MPRTAHKVESVMDPGQMNLAGVYAQALLELVPEDDRAEDIYAELEAVAGLGDEMEQLQDLLGAALRRDSQRVELVERIFHGRVEEPIEALLSVMARNGRVELLRGVVRRFRELLNERERRIEVEVTTAVALDEATKRDLTNALRDALGADPILITRVDASVLGGTVVRIGDRVIDDSLAGALNKIKKTLATRIREQSEQEMG